MQNENLFNGFATVTTVGTFTVRACRFNCGLNPEFGIVIEGSDGNVSEMLSPKLKNLERTIKDLQYSVYLFTAEECQTIYETIVNAKLPTKEISEKVPLNTLLQCIYEYANERSNPLNAYIKGDFVNIPVDEFSTFVAQRGYKALEAKKLFKRLDLLNPNDGRAYDRNDRSPEGEQHTVISIKIIQELFESCIKDDTTIAEEVALDTDPGISNVQSAKEQREDTIKPTPNISVINTGSEVVKRRRGRPKKSA